MVRREVDWKLQDRRILDWATAVVAGVLTPMYLFQWWHGSTQHAVLALGLGLWGIVYFTRFWQPILYLVAAVVLFGVTVVWFLDGTWREPLNLLTIAFNLLFVSLAVYLFRREDTIEERHTA